MRARSLKMRTARLRVHHDPSVSSNSRGIFCFITCLLVMSITVVHSPHLASLCLSALVSIELDSKDYSHQIGHNGITLLRDPNGKWRERGGWTSVRVSSKGHYMRTCREGNDEAESKVLGRWVCRISKDKTSRANEFATRMEGRGRSLVKWV